MVELAVDLNNFQEVFDHVVTCIKKQGCPSMNGNQCCYTDRKGNHCAAAWCAKNPNHVVDGKMLANQIHFPDETDEYAIRPYGLVRSLQIAHDDAGRLSFDDEDILFIPDFLRRCREIAKRFELDDKVCLV